MGRNFAIPVTLARDCRPATIQAVKRFKMWAARARITTQVHYVWNNKGSKCSIKGRMWMPTMRCTRCVTMGTVDSVLSRDADPRRARAMWMFTFERYCTDIDERQRYASFCTNTTTFRTQCFLHLVTCAIYFSVTIQNNNMRATVSQILRNHQLSCSIYFE